MTIAAISLGHIAVRLSSGRLMKEAWEISSGNGQLHFLVRSTISFQTLTDFDRYFRELQLDGFASIFQVKS